jgi:chemotaxis protein methyltransferase WspC
MRHAIVSAYVSRGFTFETNPRSALPAPTKGNARAASPAPQRSRTGAATHRVAIAAAGLSSPSARLSTQDISEAAQRAIGSKTPGARTAARSSAKKSQDPVGEAPPAGVPAELDTARRLADAGRLDEAERLAQAFVSAQGPNAEAFYLLGLIVDARGRSAEASAFYRKSLYLDPAHYEALAHLAMLLDAAGDKAAARRLMLRAERAMKHSDERRARVRTGETHGSRRS